MIESYITVRELQDRLSQADPDAIVRLRISGVPREDPPHVADGELLYLHKSSYNGCSALILSGPFED